MKYLGCAYYPEYWGRERFVEDAGLMRDAGINIVRIGEFAWVRMEPEEGVFTLDWLHECVQTLDRYGINVIMCTPTAAPPAWLTFTYSEVLLMKSDGRRMEHGGRRHYCYTHDTYRRHAARIVEKLSVEFSKYKNVVAWQIDNEPDFAGIGICHCEECEGRFQAWLKQKYGAINELNAKWGTGFWSMDYSDWIQVKLIDQDYGMPSRKLDSKKFASHMMCDFILMQYSIIKKSHPEAIVSTNFNGEVFSSIDYFNLFSKLDLPFKDLYFDMATMDVNAMIMNQFRSFKPGLKFWITETGIGALDHGKTPQKDQFKAWLWSSFAHGADAYIIFRWRTCLSGQEQELQGILEHSGYPGHRYRNVKESFLEMKELSSELGDLTMPKSEVAIVHNYDVMWGYDSLNNDYSVPGKDIKYTANFCRLQKELYKRNVLSEIIPVDRDLSGYKLVILPSLMMIDEDFAKRLSKYVSKGGVLFAQGQIGMRDFNNNYLKIKGPEHLQDLLGVYINGGMYLHSQVEADETLYFPYPFERLVDIKLGGILGSKDINGDAGAWIGDIELNSGKVLMSFLEDEYKDQPAIVEKQTGKGSSIYAAAAKLDDSLLGDLFEYVLKKAKVEFISGLPEYVEMIKRGNATFVINHRNEGVNVNLNTRGKALQGTFENGEIRLKPYGVCIVQGE